jgi:hypothetical protein
LPEGIVEWSLDAGVGVLFESNGVEVRVKVEVSRSVDEGDFDEVASQITSFEGLVEVVGGVQRLVDISNDMKQVSCHPSSFEGDSFLVGLEGRHAPVDGVDRVDVLLIGAHSLEGVIGIIYSALPLWYILVK